MPAFMPALLGKASAASGDRRAAFEQWIIQYQITPNDLCRYYRFGPHEAPESALATAYAILLFNDDHPDVADRLVAALTKLQARFASNHHVGGGLPSVANDPSYTQLFYSSDALIAIKAMMAVYKRTQSAAVLKTAAGLVQFIHRMCNGEQGGYLVQNLNFPLQYGRLDGAIQNWIVPNVSMLFWDAMSDYAAAANDTATQKLFEGGKDFLLNGTQAPNGAFYDHYNPGYPPRGYHPDKWEWFKIEKDGRKIGIGDNMMMSALGAQRMGATKNSDAFLQWAQKADQNGAFYAYIDVDTGGSGFVTGRVPYYDVVASAMYAQLLASSGGLTDAIRASVDRVFTEASASDGGYHWGINVDGTFIQNSAEALVTGYWIATT
jgi:hypothetical protein